MKYGIYDSREEQLESEFYSCTSNDLESLFRLKQAFLTLIVVSCTRDRDPKWMLSTALKGAIGHDYEEDLSQEKFDALVDSLVHIVENF